MIGLCMIAEITEYVACRLLLAPTLLHDTSTSPQLRFYPLHRLGHGLQLLRRGPEQFEVDTEILCFITDSVCFALRQLPVVL